MAQQMQMKPVAGLILFLNLCMYAIVLGIGSWAMNQAIDHGFIIGMFIQIPIQVLPYFSLTLMECNRSRIASSCSFLTCVLPNGKCRHRVLCDVCHARWSGWNCSSPGWIQPSSVLGCWQSICWCFCCQHCMDSYSSYHGVMKLSQLMLSPYWDSRIKVDYVSSILFSQIWMQRDWAALKKFPTGEPDEKFSSVEQLYII